jgi:hypothetical protein
MVERDGVESDRQLVGGVERTTEIVGTMPPKKRAPLETSGACSF